jgi:hypothetical protein
MIAYVPHASLMSPGQKRSAMMQGSVHRGWSIDTSVRSLKRSESWVMKRSEIMWNTVYIVVRWLSRMYSQGDGLPQEL